MGAVDLAYRPRRDRQADPGEIVWTWVPYEENDGRGKDRPVLIVARETRGTLLGLPLTSKPHDRGDFVALGSGAWDAEGRPSWVLLGRVLRVHQAGVRRAGVAVDARAFAAVSAALTSRYGWGAASRSRLRRLFSRLFGR